MRNKFGAIKVQFDGHSFDSKAERDCYLHLKQLEKDRKIMEIKFQVNVDLCAGVKTRIDFTYFDLILKQTVYAEYKGMDTAVWSLKKRLWAFYGPGLLRIYKGSGFNIYLDKEITVKPNK